MLLGGMILVLNNAKLAIILGSIKINYNCLSSHKADDYDACDAENDANHCLLCNDLAKR